jgi:hypothetical protein
MDSLHGFSVVESPPVPSGTVLLVNPGAFRMKIEPLPLPTTTIDPYASDLTAFRYEARLSFGTDKKVTETDPDTWSRPRGWKAWLRRLGRIVAYEYRKASGTLRQHHDPRSVGVITGIH